ncbi:MAG: serine hydrolase [Gemmatimonadetes bacterium]|nr:serine hydrolase [Gemmatimonadota bacterium]
MPVQGNRGLYTTGYADRADSTVRRDLASVGIQVRDAPGYVRLVRNSPHYGGSGVFSTVEDLAKWDATFETHVLGGPALAAQMLQTHRFAHDKDNDAFGLVFERFMGREMIWFSGGDLDASTFMARLPAERLTIICLSNMPKGDAEGRAQAVLRLVLESRTTDQGP